jgi:hypothetical protein
MIHYNKLTARSLGVIQNGVHQGFFFFFVFSIFWYQKVGKIFQDISKIQSILQ